MKRINLTVLFLIVLTNYVFSQNDQPENTAVLDKWIKTEKESNRAVTNDNVLIVIVTVKNESKSEFEDWISNVLYSALNESESKMKKAQLKVTRWLEPIHPNKDSTWTYSWIMDPLIPNTDYDITTFLNNEYGTEEGKKHWEKYLSFMAIEPQAFFLKQTDY